MIQRPLSTLSLDAGTAGLRAATCRNGSLRAVAVDLTEIGQPLDATAPVVGARRRDSDAMPPYLSERGTWHLFNRGSILNSSRRLVDRRSFPQMEDGGQRMIRDAGLTATIRSGVVVRAGICNLAFSPKSVWERDSRERQVA